MTEHGFSVTILDRLYDVEFTPPILRESERELGRPFISSIRDERGWRGFTYDEIETLLWVQVRRQNKRLTRQKFSALLDQHLTEKRGTLQEWHLVLIQAFNACDLWYQAPEPEPESEATEDGAAPLAPTPLRVVDGISPSPGASTGGSTS